MNSETSIPHQQDELPSGTVTFLFTDIEGSTELLAQLGRAFADLLAKQRDGCMRLTAMGKMRIL